VGVFAFRLVVTQLTPNCVLDNHGVPFEKEKPPGFYTEGLNLLIEFSSGASPAYPDFTSGVECPCLLHPGGWHTSGYLVLVYFLLLVPLHFQRLRLSLKGLLGSLAALRAFRIWPALRAQYASPLEVPGLTRGPPPLAGPACP
jgi:hypothetical protein